MVTGPVIILVRAACARVTPSSGRRCSRVVSLRRIALRSFFALVALNALLAIGILLAGDFTATEGRILLSSLSVTGAVLLSLACEAGRGHEWLGPAPGMGVGAAVVGFALLVVGIWTEPEGSTLWQLASSLIAVGAGVAVLGLLSLASLARRFRWTFAAAALLDALLVAMLDSAIWAQWESEWFSRVVGVVAVGLAAFLVVIPVLHRVSGREVAPGAEEAHRVAHCPSCGRAVSAAAEEEVRCPACGVRFAVRFPGAEPGDDETRQG